MKPKYFPQSNKTLTKPEGMTDEQCQSLKVWCGEDQIISLWKASWIDRLRFLFTGQMWLRVRSSSTHPPVSLETENPWS